MTIKSEYIKHPKLQRRSLGTYGTCEWAIYGTPCDKIEAFYNELAEHFLGHFDLCYVDADHSTNEIGTEKQFGKKKFRSEKVLFNEYHDKLEAKDHDAVLINGNHYLEAARQIIFIDPSKKDSLKRKVQYLNTIDMVLMVDDSTGIFDFVENKMTSDTLVYSIDEKEKIWSFFAEKIGSSVPKLKALVLAGGKSTRMGSDKSQITYREEISQQKYMADLCTSLGLETYISKGIDHVGEEAEGFPVVKDRLVDMGPYGAITSAFMFDPNGAWLVLACDLPFIGKKDIQRLIDERDPSKNATSLKGAAKEFPEPLITIYEPKIYSKFLDFLSLGYSCPRKVLINSDIKELLVEEEQVIANANTPEERESAMEKMRIPHE